jgi:hypothetical protein
MIKKLIVTSFLPLFILLSGCQNTPTEQSPSIPALGSTETPTQPTPSAEATEDQVPLTRQTPTSEVPTAGPLPTVTVEKPVVLLPSPSLFSTSWEDLAIFQSGLISEEAGILEDLPAATIYHLILDINDPNLVIGEMEARYFNQEVEPLNELFLHLFAEKLGGDIEISELLVNGEPAPFATTNGMLQVDLAEPLAPGQGVVLSLKFETTVPGEETTKYGVLAYKENILALAHFYPMFAVFDDQGWHTEPTADHGDETFADMSFYLVQVSAPADQVLVTSGVEVTRDEHDGLQRVTYAAGPARDFYLVASDEFEMVQEQVGEVLLRSFAPSGLLDGAQLALDVTADSLQSFSSRFGPYPYSELDVVSTPTDALGIEYPGIYANALRIYDLSEDSASGVSNRTLIESVSAHETAHQWFYNLVGNDQLNEPWLDEAVTQYATWLYYIDRYGEQNAQGLYDSFEGRWGRTDFAEIPIGLPADAYNGLEYSAIVYGRGPIFLHELAGIMGQETFDEFLRDYAETYRWQIAYGNDFLALAEAHCACDLSGLFNTEVFGN